MTYGKVYEAPTLSEWNRILDFAQSDGCVFRSEMDRENWEKTWENYKSDSCIRWDRDGKDLQFCERIYYENNGYKIETLSRLRHPTIRR